ncbi:MAG: EAL domain-containing protein [Sphingomonas sp.]
METGRGVNKADAIRAGVSTPLFLLSPDRRDDLSAVAARGGWRVVAADDGADVERRFLGSGAAVALIDARGAVPAALAATKELGETVAANGAALIVLLDAPDASALASLFDAGATHFLIEPFGDDQLIQALRFAGRHADRIGAVRQSPAAVGDNSLSPAAARRWLDRALSSSGGRVSALLIALMRFDLVNASYGRAAGDALLSIARQRIDDIAGELYGAGAIVARLSGSEFLLAAPDPDSRAALVAERVASALVRPFAIAETPVVIGSRIGVAVGVAGTEAGALLRRASEALAEAKASDSATIRMAGGGTGEESLPIEKLAIDLRHALDRDEIDLMFQPQVAIGPGTIVGVEALARWEHGRLGALGAETLFAAAERADLAIALSDRIQHKALAAAARWPASLSGLRLSINLTAADIARPGFADLFLDRVDTSGFPRGRLTVEITESGLIDDLGAAAALLATLRGAGCRVAIDDFGTGYSSLAYLKALPLDYLKIDKKLAQDIAGTPRDRIVVRGVIEMARSLGLAVIAEGVETPEQLDLLAKEGCNYYQGFLCAEALSSEALAALVETEESGR